MRTVASLRILAAPAIAVMLALPASGIASAEDRADVTPRSPARPCTIIAHRGASGYLPEHTLEAYALAVRLGADFIEPDLVMTGDGVLVARHDNVLNLTTNVAEHPEFAGRKTVKSVDGERVEGWFSEDFTLAELKTLRAVERIPDVRPRNAVYDGLFAIPTFSEIVALVADLRAETGRTIGIYPETKHPTYFHAAGLPMERILVEILERNGFKGREAPVFLQSFEIGNLMELRKMTDLRLIQLLWKEGKPFDVQAAGGATTYDSMATPAGLQAIAAYADGVGPEKNHFIIPLDGKGELDTGQATSFVADSHAAGLVVHPYTFRAENHFLPAQFRSGGPATAHGDLDGEIAAFLALGIDGFFTDDTDAGVRACRALAANGS